LGTKERVLEETQQIQARQDYAGDFFIETKRQNGVGEAVDSLRHSKHCTGTRSDWSEPVVNSELPWKWIHNLELEWDHGQGDGVGA